MQQWEYKLIEIKRTVQLNQLGLKGWELVTVVRFEESNKTFWIFKKPI